MQNTKETKVETRREETLQNKIDIDFCEKERMLQNRRLFLLLPIPPFWPGKKSQQSKGRQARANRTGSIFSVSISLECFFSQQNHKKPHPQFRTKSHIATALVYNSFFSDWEKKFFAQGLVFPGKEWCSLNGPLHKGDLISGIFGKVTRLKAIFRGVILLRRDWPVSYGQYLPQADRKVF